MATEQRTCLYCGEPLDGHRSDALHCSPTCRAECWRFAALLAGRQVGNYRCLRDRVEAIGRARRRRTQKPPDAVE